MTEFHTIDYTPLTAPVSSADVRAFKADARRSGQPWAQVTTATVLAWLLASLVVVVFLAVAVPIVATTAGMVLTGQISPAEMVVLGFFPAVAFAVAVVVAGALIRSGSLGGRWRRWYRLDRFASANGFQALPSSPGPAYAGAVFGIGSARSAYDRIISNGRRMLDIGNYRYTTGSGKSRRTHNWTFMALRLDRRLPHMVLDATSNNRLFGATNLPTTFHREQVLKLEGDFNDWFTLYCPREYETDALYVFSPDFMALLIDHARAFDVEIVDDWMFVYSSTPLDTTDPQVLRRMFSIAGVIGGKALSQTGNYRDERMVPTGSLALDGAAASGNLIAAPGRRLRKSTNWVAIGAVALVGVAWLWMNTLIR